MDLLATVRKEGSRGGSGNFQWSDVQNSSRRENYLGHSLMAPVGRWSKGRDLNWYAKADGATTDGEDPAATAARERKEEIRRIKQAEEDALARELGLPVAPRSDANAEPVNSKREFEKTMATAETSADNDEITGRGIGFGKHARHGHEATTETIEGNADSQDKELQSALKEYRRRHDDRKSSHRSSDRSHRVHKSDDRYRRRDHERSRDRHRDRSPYRRRSRSPETRRHRRRSRSPQKKENRPRRPRSRSPY